VTDRERLLLEKEIMGLTARLRWDHVSEHVKDVWRERIQEIRIRLATEQQTG
jgi:hypothetical protein